MVINHNQSLETRKKITGHNSPSYVSFNVTKSIFLFIGGSKLDGTSANKYWLLLVLFCRT